MAVSLISTGVQFPDNSIQTTASSSGVTSITAGTGLTGGTITTTGTIAVDIYTGTDANNLSFAIGSYLAVNLQDINVNRNATTTIRLTPSGTTQYWNGDTGSIVAGTWRARGRSGSESGGGKTPVSTFWHLFQRTA
jgi:hypothetical protein